MKNKANFFYEKTFFLKIISPFFLLHNLVTFVGQQNFFLDKKKLEKKSLRVKIFFLVFMRRHGVFKWGGTSDAPPTFFSSDLD